jgi:O-antigen/teichoic acid export membrane protein
MIGKMIRRYMDGRPPGAGLRLRWVKLGLNRVLEQKSFTRKMIGSVFTQTLMSATNFLIGLFLIRTAAKTEYGLYVVCFSIVQIFIGVQNALVNTPLTVLYPDKKGKQKESFLSGLAIGQWAVLGPLVLMSGLGYAIFSWLRPVPPDQFKTVFTLLLAVPAAYLREFIRVLQYCRLDIQSVIRSDGLFVACVLAGLILLNMTSGASASGVLSVVAAAYFFSGILAHRLSGQTYRLNASWIRECFRETWPLSRWALFGVVVTHIQSFGYIFIISSWMGLSDTADISAARLFFMPFGILLASSQRIVLAKGAQVLFENAAKFNELIAAFLGLFAGLWFLYFLIVYAVHATVIQAVFTSKYSEINRIILVWGGFFLVNSLSFTFSHALQAMKDFKMLSIVGAIAAAVTLITCLALTSRFGSEGGLWALIAGEAVVFSACALRYRLLLARIRRINPAAAGAIE